MVGVVARVFAITILPLAIGMALRARDPERVDRLEPRIKRVALSVFVLVVAGAIATEAGTIAEHFTDLAVATLTLNVAAMSISFTIARAARLNNAQSTAIALELGVHNSTLAIAVATSVANVLATPAAVYSMFMFFTAGAFAWVMYRRNAPVAVA
jgi:BASS family bile acid:Na+ symporter